MENKQANGEWVDGKLAALNPRADWAPDVEGARRAWRSEAGPASFGRRRFLNAGLAAGVALGGLMVVPEGRAFAGKCVDACVGEGTWSDFWDAHVRWFHKHVGKTLHGDRWEMAPALEAQDAQGRTLRLADLRGKVVLVNFWASWCPPCAQEMPWLEGLAQRKSAEGLVVLGVAMDEKGWATAKPVIEKTGVRYANVLGNPELADAFRARSLPTTVLVDRNGKIVWKYSGVLTADITEESVGKVLREGK